MWIVWDSRYAYGFDRDEIVDEMFFFLSFFFFFYRADSTPRDDEVEVLRSSECLVWDESMDVTESLSLLCGLE